jgi:hypothetical protein
LVAAASAILPAAAADTANLAAGFSAPAPRVERGYLLLDFYWLSKFNFVRPDALDAASAPAAKADEQIPPLVKSWSGKKVVLTGFMLPLVFQDGKTTQFLLMANLMLCCYATVPKVNDWVVVQLPGGTDVIQDQPIEFRGVFHVGPQFDGGVLSSVYQMDAEGPGILKDGNL